MRTLTHVFHYVLLWSRASPKATFSSASASVRETQLPATVSPASGWKWAYGSIFVIQCVCTHCRTQGDGEMRSNYHTHTCARAHTRTHTNAHTKQTKKTHHWETTLTENLTHKRSVSRSQLSFNFRQDLDFVIWMSGLLWDLHLKGKTL